MPTLMEDPTPAWLKPENASVLDPAWVKLLRAIATANPLPKGLQDRLPNPNPAAMALDPQSQVLALMGADVPSGGPRIEGWHGSPADFDRFDSKYIGTGEGAQAYGHGLYIAEKEDIAKGYRDRLSGVKGHIPGASTGRGQWMVNGVPPPEGIAGHAALDTAQDLQGLLYYKKHGYADMADVVQPQIERRIATFRAEDAKGYHQGIAGEDMRALADYYDTHVRHATPEMIGARPPGKLYQVAIHADPEHFLDWDKPLREQSERVRNNPAIRDLNTASAFGYHLPEFQALPAEKQAELTARAPWVLGNKTGQAVLQEMKDALPLKVSRSEAAALASQHLKEAGIPGVKYLDAGSRAAGEGSYNYSVFDDKLLEILRKFGLLLPAIGTGAATYGGPFQQSQEAK